MQQLTGIVVNAAMPKTAKVQVTRRWTHPLYHKTITKRKSYLVHCEIEVKTGDKVLMVPTKPMSKMKRWKVSKKL